MTRCRPLPDGCFALEPLAVTSEALVREIRRFRPHVVTTYDENGGYPHPDHVMCHDVSMAAVVAAGDPDAFPHAGPPWQPLKVYYNQTFSRARIEAFHEALTALGEESPYAEWLESWSRPDRTVTTRVECSDWFERRDAALLAHATQVDPDGTWFRVPARCRPGCGRRRTSRRRCPSCPSPRGRTTSSPASRRTSRRPTRSRPRQHPVRRPRHQDGACPVNDAPTADGGPGFLAFVAFFLLALALWFLMRNMNARMRRMSYRQQQAHRGPNDPQAAPDEASAGEPRDERDGDRAGCREGPAGRRPPDRPWSRPRRPRPADP